LTSSNTELQLGQFVGASILVICIPLKLNKYYTHI
jgi:hypothetical protein